MTARQKADAEEKRLHIFQAAHWQCAVCGESIQRHGTPMLGHRVPKTRGNLESWGPEVIHHELNLIPVCSLAHNDAVSIGSFGAKVNDLLLRIVRINTERESMPNLADYYRSVGEEVREKQNA